MRLGLILACGENVRAASLSTAPVRRDMVQRDRARRKCNMKFR